MTHETLKTLLISIAACAIGLVLGVVGVTYVSRMQRPEIPPQQDIVTQPPSPPQEVAPIVEKVGASWLPMPMLLSEDLKLFSYTEEEKTNFSDGDPKVNYYKTGTDGTSDVLIAEIPIDGPCMDTCAQLVYLIKTATGYSLIQKMSPTFFESDGTYNGPTLHSLVTIDSEKEYTSLKAPHEVAYQMGKLTFQDEEPGFLPSNDYYEKLTKLTDIPLIGTLYERSEPIEAIPGASSHAYYLRKLNGLKVDYEYTPPILSDDFVLKTTWSNGVVNKEAYQLISTGGCGASGGTPVLTDPLTPLTQSGMTSVGAIYEFKDINNPLLKSVYDVVKQSSEKPVSYKEWIKKHPVVIFKDIFGRALLFNNTTYGPQVECGKPVIYLYPTQPTDITVSVDAHIRISEPTYGTGWAVHAKPDGSLYTSDGAHYGSLYWEGLGYGAYPTWKKGFIVAQEDIEVTLRSHLNLLGLNQKESDEFLAFWLEKMPHTPYVRLSWMGTHEMNTLAPLTVKPHPDTMIRIFLDFEGLEKPLSIEQQQLSSIPRKGFTLIEWGGLLRK